MTNSKNTKRALLTSIMALVLCFTMLTGTTFAWFTDTETSSGNKIVAGNLDIDLLMFDADATTADKYVSIADEVGAIFGANSLIAKNDPTDTVWEPGKTQIAYLAVRNLGNLALKYNIIVDVEDNGLIGALEYAIVPVQGGTADATTLEQSNWANIKANYENGVLAAGKTIAAPNGCLDEIKGGVQNETDFFALVIHMDENAGNEYKEKSVVIDITVNATQVEAENDAFGPNYDQGLEIAASKTEDVSDKIANNLTTEEVIIDAENAIATVPVGTKVEDGTTELKLVKTPDEAHTNLVIANDEYVVAYDIDIEGVDENNTETITVVLKKALPTNLTNVTVYHDGEAMVSGTDFAYDSATGDVTLFVKHFSNFTFTTDENVKFAVSNADELAAALASGKNAALKNDISLENKITIPAGISVILDLNGKIISGACTTNQGTMFEVANTATLTVEDNIGTGKITYAGDNSTGWIVDLEGNLVMNSGTLELTGTWNIGYAVDVRPNAWGTAYEKATTFTMNGGKIISSDGAVRVASSSADQYKDVSASFTMNGGIIDADWDGIFVQQSNATWDDLKVTINNGTIKSDLNPLRIYGPAATGYVNTPNCISISLNNNATLSYTGTEARENWLIDGKIRYGGGATEEQILADTTITIIDTLNDGTVLAQAHNDEDNVALYSVKNVNATEYTVPENVTELGSGVFASNTGITKVTIPASVTDFGATGVSATGASSGAFKGSTVTSVVLEEGITEIPAAAFNGAKNLSSVNIPSSVTTIGVNAFRQTAITELTVPATVTNISYGAFRDMTSLTTVTFEGDNVTIPNYAFRGCTNLRTVYLNAETATIGTNMAFANASSNNPGTNNITFYVKNEAIAEQIKASMGVGSYVAIYVDGTLYAEIK